MTNAAYARFSALTAGASKNRRAESSTIRAVVGPNFSRKRSSSASWAFAASTGAVVDGLVGLPPCGLLSVTVGPLVPGRFVAVVLAAATCVAVSGGTAPVPSFLPSNAIPPPTAPNTTTAPTAIGTTERFFAGPGAAFIAAVLALVLSSSCVLASVSARVRGMAAGASRPVPVTDATLSVNLVTVW